MEVTDTNMSEFRYTWNGTQRSLLDSGLVLMMNFDNVTALGENSSTVKDMSQYGNHGTVNGATSTASGKWGGAYSFDGVNDYIDTNKDISWNNTNRITISFWLNPSSVSTVN